MHDTEESGVALKLVWLERGLAKTSADAGVLPTADFHDFGKQLMLLTTQTLIPFPSKVLNPPELISSVSTGYDSGGGLTTCMR